MATANPEIELEEKTEGVTLEGGTYEIIRKRLETQAETLRLRLHKLNEARKEVFGAIESKLIATNRIATENNCSPQDMVALGPLFIFGYNVQVRLKSIELADVFSVFRYDSQDHSFHTAPLDLIAHEKFVQDFLEMYKFYKDTVFLKFAVLGPHLYMVFQVGKRLRTLRFLNGPLLAKTGIYQ
ncbi:MAG: hypothetical protein HC913_06250 [Microscillaceae bacterium]|nr:hypothetical protein [Microscillaceae bacterium]